MNNLIKNNLSVTALFMLFLFHTSSAHPSWDRSSIEVTGECVDDSLACFTISNSGEAGRGDMAGISEWRLFSRDSLIQSDSFQLAGGESITLCFESDGGILRFEADQRPGHPGFSRPRASVEGCGGEADTTSSGSNNGGNNGRPGLPNGNWQFTPAAPVITHIFDLLSQRGRIPGQVIDVSGDDNTPIVFSPKSEEQAPSERSGMASGNTIKISIYPNPFSSEATLSVNGQALNDISFSLFDVSGKEVAFYQDIKSKTIISRNQLPAGIYHFRVVSSSQGLLDSGRILIQ